LLLFGVCVFALELREQQRGDLLVGDSERFAVGAAELDEERGPIGHQWAPTARPRPWRQSDEVATKGSETGD
jgi:hypothetical protein